jgi:retron-type reverse transcriptase
VQNLKLKKTPPLTLETFLSTLTISPRILEDILSNKKKFYYSYKQPKKKGGYRTITPSTKELKDVQSHVQAFINKQINWPSYIHGGIKERSVLTNARSHVGKYMIINIDIKDCFPNTSSDIINEALLVVGFEKKLAMLLSNICTYNNSVPQGAPSSTCIVNIALGLIDGKFSRLCNKNNFNYTRFVDDITISGDIDLRPFKNAFTGFVESMNYPISSYVPLDRSKRQVVTGLVVNDKIRPTATFIQQLKADIKSGWIGQDEVELVANAYGLSFHELKNNIWGRISFLKSIDKKRGREIRGLMTKGIWSKEGMDN